MLDLREYLLCRMHLLDLEVTAVATDITLHWFINVLLFLTPTFSRRQSVQSWQLQMRST